MLSPRRGEPQVVKLWMRGAVRMRVRVYVCASRKEKNSPHLSRNMFTRRYVISRGLSEFTANYRRVSVCHRAVSRQRDCLIAPQIDASLYLLAAISLLYVEEFFFSQKKKGNELRISFFSEIEISPKSFRIFYNALFRDSLAKTWLTIMGRGDSKCKK